jgi:hypothetical protein
MSQSPDPAAEQAEFDWFRATLGLDLAIQAERNGVFHFLHP